MDTHYPDSVEDFDTIDEEDNILDEEALVAQQELSEQAKKIEEEFRNVFYEGNQMKKVKNTNDIDHRYKVSGYELAL